MEWILLCHIQQQTQLQRGIIYKFRDNTLRTIVVNGGTNVLNVKGESA